MMVTYSLGRKYKCWQCQREESVCAKLGKCNAEWICGKCGAVNGVIIDQVRVRVGAQLLQAGRDCIKRNEFDFAAVLLAAAVDASLGIGIRELTIWRAIERREAPPLQDKIDETLRCMRNEEKLKEFERLTGVTMKNEIESLHKEGKIAANVLGGYNRLITDVEKLQRERNRLVHMGEPVNEVIVREGVAAVQRAIYVLEEMYRRTFSLKRPQLNQPKSLGKRSKGKRPKAKRNQIKNA